MPLPPIYMLYYNAYNFYKALPIFLCPGLMCVYDIPMSWFDVCLWYSYVLLMFCCLVILLSCCPHAPLPCLHPRLAVVVLAATHPIRPQYGLPFQLPTQIPWSAEFPKLDWKDYFVAGLSVDMVPRQLTKGWQEVHDKGVKKVACRS
jgi:hypothetical protein